MQQHRFLQPSPPTPNFAPLKLSRNGIPIHWEEVEVLPIKIRRRYDVEMFRRLRCVPLKRGDRLDYGGLATPESRPQTIFRSSPGRQAI